MIKFRHGWIGNQNGDQYDIIVKAAAPNKLKDALIGGGMMVAGIIYLTYTAFKYGAEQFERAELYTMKDAGIIDWNPEEVLTESRIV
jgi:protein-L-isoaspartate O-methyltransferase